MKKNPWTHVEANNAGNEQDFMAPTGDDHEGEEIIFETESEYDGWEKSEVWLEADNEEAENPGLRRTEFVWVPNQKNQHLSLNNPTMEKYASNNALIIGMIMMQLTVNKKFAGVDDKIAYSFIQTYSLKAWSKKFGKRGKKAALKEIWQLHN